MDQAATMTPAAAPNPASAGADTALTAAPVPAPVAADPAAAPVAAPAAAAEPANASDAAPADGDQKPAARAPAEYADFTGTDLTPEIKAQFGAYARDLDLTQEQAQKLVELGAKHDKAMTDEVAAQSTKWLNELPSDKEFGGEKLSENLAIAKKAIDTFGTPELKDILEKTRLGNHPELIRAFYRAGKAISQDTRFVAGGSGAKPAKADAASALYPNQKSA